MQWNIKGLINRSLLNAHRFIDLLLALLAQKCFNFLHLAPFHSTNFSSGFDGVDDSFTLGSQVTLDFGFYALH